MRFLCDVHISIGLVKALNALGHEAIHVNRILDGSRTTDKAIATFADKNDWILITKDADFRDSHFVKHTPKKLIRICLGNLKNTELISLFEHHLPRIEASAKADKFYIEISANLLTVFGNM